MPGGPSALAVAALLFAIASTGCDRPANPNGPAAFAFEPTGPTVNTAATAQIQPQTLPVIPAPIFACPSSSPLTTSLNLIIASPATAVTLSQVGFQIFDINGLAAAPTLLTSTQLNGQFGTTTVAAGTTRSFALQPQFGCGIAAPASLATSLVLTSLTGIPRQMTLTTRFAR